MATSKIQQLTPITEPVALTKTSAVTTSGSSAYRSGDVIVIRVDVTMASSYSGWVNVLELNASTLKLSGYNIFIPTDGTSSFIYGQVFDNGGIPTVRFAGCQAKQYRGECVVIVGE